MCLARSVVQISRATRSPRLRPQGTIHFKEETVSLCHPERSEGSPAGQRSFAALRMTILHRLRLTRKTSYLKCIGVKGDPCGRPECYSERSATIGSSCEARIAG